MLPATISKEVPTYLQKQTVVLLPIIIESMHISLVSISRCWKGKWHRTGLVECGVKYYDLILFELRQLRFSFPLIFL